MIASTPPTVPSLSLGSFYKRFVIKSLTSSDILILYQGGGNLTSAFLIISNIHI